MWTFLYHRFADRAAYADACAAAGLAIDAAGDIDTGTVSLAPLGPIDGEPPGYYVMSAWLGDPPSAFAGSAVTLANPPRVWAT